MLGTGFPCTLFWPVIDYQYFQITSVELYDHGNFYDFINRKLLHWNISSKDVIFVKTTNIIFLFIWYAKNFKKCNIIIIKIVIILKFEILKILNPIIIKIQIFYDFFREKIENAIFFLLRCNKNCLRQLASVILISFKQKIDLNF